MGGRTKSDDLVSSLLEGRVRPAPVITVRPGPGRRLGGKRGSDDGEEKGADSPKSDRIVPNGETYHTLGAKKAKRLSLQLQTAMKLKGTDFALEVSFTPHGYDA